MKCYSEPELWIALIGLVMLAVLWGALLVSYAHWLRDK